MIRLLGALTMTALLGISASATAAVELEDFDDSSLMDDWRATAVLGGDAVGSDGAHVGSVQELILGEDGLIQSVVVSRPAGSDNLDMEYLEVAWSKADFKPLEGEVKLTFTAAEANDKAWGDFPPVAGINQWKASRLIGMDVDSTEDVPEGTVEDILFTPGANDMSAFVVESPIEDEDYYALPGDPEFVDFEEGELDLPYTAEAIEDLPALAY